jgi:hypothetical protein
MAVRAVANPRPAVAMKEEEMKHQLNREYLAECMEQLAEAMQEKDGEKFQSALRGLSLVMTNDNKARDILSEEERRRLKKMFKGLLEFLGR